MSCKYESCALSIGGMDKGKVCYLSKVGPYVGVCVTNNGGPFDPNEKKMVVFENISGSKKPSEGRHVPNRMERILTDMITKNRAPMYII